MSFKPIERTLQLILPGETRFRNIYLVFNITRTPISLAPSMDPRGFEQRDAGFLLTGESIPLPTHPNVLAFEIIDPIVARDELRGLRFQSLGEVPELVNVVLEGPERLLVAKSRSRPCLDTIDLEFQDLPGTAAQFVPGPKQYLIQLENELQRLSEPRASASRFFAELDRLTSSVLGASFQVTTSIDVVSLMTQQRLVARREQQTQSPGSYVPYSFSTTELQDLELVAELFVRCAAKHLGPVAPGADPALRRPKRRAVSASERALARVGIDPTRFEDAFESFADGQLRLQLSPSGMWSTQPSSGFYFYFAELALLAAEAKLDAPLSPKLWTTLVNVMIRTQETYCARYGPEKFLKPDRDTSSYGACQYRLDADLDKPSIQRKAEMRQKFKKKSSLKALAIECAKNANNLLRLEA